MNAIKQLYWIVFVFSCMWGASLPGIQLPGIMLFPLRIMLFGMVVIDLFTLIRRRQGKISIDHDDLPPIFLLITGGITIVWSCNRDASISSFLVYLTSILVTLIVKARIKTGSLNYILNAIYINIIIMGATAIYESMTGQYFTVSYEYYLRTFNVFGMIRPKAAFFNTNNLAVFFLISLPMALLAAEKWKFATIGKTIIFVLSAAIILLTGSRMGIVGMLLCSGLYIIYRMYSSNGSKKFLGVAIGILGLAVGVFFLPSNVWRVFEGTRIGDESRWEIWKGAITASENYIFMGSGIGTSKYAEGSLGSPHNYIIEILLEFGFVGAICFLLLLYKTVPSLKSAKSNVSYSYLRMFFWVFLLGAICASTLQGFYFIWLYWAIGLTINNSYGKSNAIIGGEQLA